MKKIILLFFITISCLYSNIIIDHNNKYNNFELKVYEDKADKLSIKDIKQVNFTKTSSNNFNLGRTKGSYWFKIDVQNNSNKENFVLSVSESFYEKFELYEDKIHKTGLRQKVENREIKSNELAFNLNIKKNQSKTLYIKLKAHFSYFGNFVLYEKESFAMYSFFGINTFFVFLVGVFFLIFLFNLFLYIKLKEKIYCYYIFYVFFITMYSLNLSGLLTYFGLSKYLYLLQFSTSYAIGFFILFSLQLLETKKYLPKIDKTMKFFAIVSFVMGTLFFFTFKITQIANSLNSLLMIILMFISFAIFFKNHSKSKYYILAIALYNTSLFIFVSMIEGVYEYNFFTRYGFFLAIFIEVNIFALILANRYNELKNAVIETQRTLIKTKTQHEAILEHKIEERTKEITVLLNDKNLLLKELYHRVKNNFHMLIGILWLEDKKNGTVDLQTIINRVQSMSTVHETLYTTENISNINTKDYLSKILLNLSTTYPQIKLKTFLEDFNIKIDDSISLGLIINEIFTNSIKHNSHKDSISIDFSLCKKDDEISVVIKDDGTGFDPDQITKGLGLKIIEQYSKSLLNSTYDFNSKDGSLFELRFNP